MHWHIHNKQAAIWFPKILWLLQYREAEEEWKIVLMSVSQSFISKILSLFVKMFSQRAEIGLNPVEYREAEVV